MNGFLRNIKIKLIASAAYICLMLFLIALSVVLTLNISGIILSVNHAQIADVNHGQVMSDYRRLLFYLQVPFTNLHFEYFLSSTSGYHHFADVKSLMMLNEVVLLLVAVPASRYLIQQKRRHQLWQLVTPIKYSVIVVLMATFILMVNFDKLFIQFHKAVFSNNDWFFDPITDPIINVLTTNFFIICVLIFIILLLSFLSVIIIIGRRDLRRND